ncbi:MAG TPA: IS5 family transposase [Saprospiraceae bacterium]|nr:IS5 family transposase [Saprospiraceae bacterium]
MKQFKKHKDYGFFDQDFRLTKLTKLGDPLEKLAQGVDFDIFRSILNENLSKIAHGKGGRRPYDYVMMFKILILQRYYNLSDDQVEYQINDRMSFMRFLDLTIADDVPDSKTVWNFKEQLINADITEKLFDLFLSHLNKLGLIVNEGKIVDASFVEVPKQRNTKAENEIIKGGGIPQTFQENKHKLSHKDTDAEWTTKNKTHYYGYKNHIKADSKSKIITKYTVTGASVHDSQPLEDLLEAKDANEPLYADSAYTGEKQETTIAEQEMTNEVCEKGYRNNPLTEEQKVNNTKKSKIRSRVEHIFGFMEMSMNGMYLNAIGKKRISSMIGMMNLTYNMFRKIQLQAI